MSQGSWRKFDCVFEKEPRCPGCISSHFRAQYLAGQRSEAPKSSICVRQNVSVALGRSKSREFQIFAFGFEELGWTRKAYLCGDYVELELLPIVIGLFECLNLGLTIRIIS